MIKKNYLEIITGFVILLSAIIFVSYAFGKSGKKANNNSYIIKGAFNNIAGIEEGADIKISGVKIGRISKIELSKDFEAIVEMEIDDNINIPFDSNASIKTNGVVGGKYMEINPGMDSKYLTDNDFIEYTQSSILLEDLISKLMFKKNN